MIRKQKDFILLQFPEGRPVAKYDLEQFDLNIFVGDTWICGKTHTVNGVTYTESKTYWYRRDYRAVQFYYEWIEITQADVDSKTTSRDPILPIATVSQEANKTFRKPTPPEDTDNPYRSIKKGDTWVPTENFEGYKKGTSYTCNEISDGTSGPKWVLTNDKVVNTFYQADIPDGRIVTTRDIDYALELYLDDLWLCTKSVIHSTGTYTKGHIYKYLRSGTAPNYTYSWIDDSNVPADQVRNPEEVAKAKGIFDLIDGKGTTYLPEDKAGSDLPQEYSKNDVLIVPSDLLVMRTAPAVGVERRFWKKRRYTARYQSQDVG